MNDKLIQASEIGDYVYCNRAWWLDKIEGNESQNQEAMMRGTRYHVDHRNMVAKSQRGRQVALAFGFVALACLLYWFASGF